MFDLLASPAGIRYVEKQFQKGDTILDPNHSATCFYILAKGRAAVYHQSPKGTLTNIYACVAPDYFGEVKLLCPQLDTPQYASPLLIIAKTDCTLRIVQKQDFFNWLRQDFDFSLFLMQRLCQKMLHGTWERGHQASMTIRERLLHTVQRHADAGDLPLLTKAQLCEEVGTSMRCLNRALAESKDFVQYQSKTFVLQDNASR